MEVKSEDVANLEQRLAYLLDELSDVQSRILKLLREHADQKVLKGNELVGWLGEIYGKMLLGGRLVDDSLEHDFEANPDYRVSVKTRKGTGANWSRTSAIPLIEGEGCPTHLMFVHLNDTYRLRRVWLYPWADLLDKSRFRKHVVRGNFRSYYFTVREADDEKYCISRSAT